MEKPPRRTLLRKLLGVALLLLICGYAALLFAMNRAMHAPPEQFGRFMSNLPPAVFLVAPFETMWMRARAGSVKIGDAAPEFTLSTLDKTAHVTLASIRSDRPVVLVFGSYT